MIDVKHTKFLLLLLALLPIVFLMQLFIGSVNISPKVIVEILTGNSDESLYQTIILKNRLPGALAAVVAGAALSVSGLQMQIMFRNPIAGPYILGISAGASLGVALVLMGLHFLPQQSFLAHWLNMPFSIAVAAAVGTALVFLIIFLISLSVRQSVSLLIIGLMIGSAISALVELLQAFSGKEELQKFVLWGFASFRNITLHEVKILYAGCAIGLALSISLIKPMQALLGGEVFAETVGVEVNKVKRKIILSTAILVGSVTAFCGPVAFVGLAVPHICRSVLKTSNTFVLMMYSIIVGAIVCCICNIISSVPGSDMVLPLNIVTSLLGAPFVIYILFKKTTFA